MDTIKDIFERHFPTLPPLELDLGCTLQDIDGCCLHPGNMTPECYPDTCRLRIAPDPLAESKP